MFKSDILLASEFCLVIKTMEQKYYELLWIKNMVNYFINALFFAEIELMYIFEVCRLVDAKNLSQNLERFIKAVFILK